MAKPPIRYDFDFVRMEQGLRVKARALPISVFSKQASESELLARVMPLVRRHVRFGRGLTVRRCGWSLEGTRASCYVYTR